MSNDFDNVYVQIWEGYKYFVRTAYVMRSGFQLAGLTNTTDKDESVGSVFKRRNESVLEHSAKVAFLAGIFSSHFPNFFGTDRLWHSDGSLGDWATMVVSLLHDVGEIVVGDIPDDGSPLHNSKDEIEREVFCNSIATIYSPEEEFLLKEVYTGFQFHDTWTGQAIYCLDKLEAVLELLWLEQNGLYGDVTIKNAPTKQDLYYIGLTGTSCVTDVWAAHLKTHLQPLPQQMTRYIFALLRAAVMDVRGEWFEWWNHV